MVSTFFETQRWYAINTRPKDEFRAEMNLTAWGIETLAPKIKECRRNQFTDHPTYFTKPLFPRYIFARFDAERLIHKVQHTRGVHSVVRFDNRPLEVGDDAIALIRSRMDKNGIVRMDDDLRPGDELIINHGPFKGLSGIFDRRIKGTNRVMILLSAVNYQPLVMVDKSLVHKSDSSLYQTA